MRGVRQGIGRLHHTPSSTNDRSISERHHSVTRLFVRAGRSDRLTYLLTPRGEDAAYVLLAFLRYGLKYHAPLLEATRLKPLPSFQDLVKEYYGRRPQN